VAGVPVPPAGPFMTATFPNNTLGGQVKFEADYNVTDDSGNVFLAGKATLGWQLNNSQNVASVTLILVEYPWPLTASTVYGHAQLLTYQNGAYDWQATTTPPTATLNDANGGSTGNNISEWTGLTLSQRAGMLGFAWKAAGMGIVSCVSGASGQLAAMENMALPGSAAMAAKLPSCGLDSNTAIVYDPYPPTFEMQNGQWVLNNGQPVPDPNSPSLGDYYVDPRKADNSPGADGGYHLRSITLDDTTPFNMAGTQLSYGRMRYQPDSIVLHPSGHFIAINAQYSKIQIGKLILAGAADDTVPFARVYSGRASVVGRPGLLFHPVAVSCSYDGTILVLEDTKSSGTNALILARIQAFDLRGRPVNRFFDASGNPTPFLEISTSGANTYLDLSVVGDQKLTYMFVLYYTGGDNEAANYNIAVYQYGEQAPASNPLFTNNGVAAANITVDMWHTLYALNCAMTTDGNGNNAGPAGANPADTGPAGVTVPSVSQWLP
jgi:hypothetical protein